MIELEWRGGLAEVTLDRAPVNALDQDMVERLADVIAEIERQQDAQGVVVRSARHVFCAGADIRMLSGMVARSDGARLLTQYAGRLQSVLARLASLPVVTVAEVNGAATGGGLELALACDIRLAATTARIGLTEANIGLVPGAGGTQRMTAAAGRSRAMLALLGGELMSAESALRTALVDEVVPPEALRDRTDALLAIIRQREREVIVEVKRCVQDAGTAKGFHTELEATERLAGRSGTHDLMTKFLNRDKAGRSVK